LKSELAAASLFVGNDSGPAHMAAAFGVPSVVIFGPSDPAIWGPWRTTGEVVAMDSGVNEVLAALQRWRVPA
jgi:heptosyltransferase-3